ncbi:MAG: ABC transporter permease [Bacteroidota bacterium]
MLKNYFVVAVRSLRRRKVYAAINIVGLAMGLTCCLLIAQYVRHERSYDAFHTETERLYRVVKDVTDREGRVYPDNMTSVPYAPTFKADLPEVTEATRLAWGGRVLSYGTQRLSANNLYYADPDFLRLFSFPWQAGDPATALEEPGSLVLTADFATKLFGDEDPMGQTVLSDNEETLRVTGVLTIPPRSSLTFEGLVSFATWTQDSSAETQEWDNNFLTTYVGLQPGADPSALAEQMTGLYNQYANPEETSTQDIQVQLEAFADIYLHSSYGGPGDGGSGRNLLLFTIIGLFILGIALVNFVNLATARSAERAKEVGVRKSIGAHAGTVRLQFLCEAVVVTAVAAVLALALVQMAQPAFVGLVGKALPLSMGLAEGAVVLGLVLATGLLAGGYPAFVLARFEPARVLKGSALSTHGGQKLRQSLVTLQFAVAVGLIAATTIVVQQIQYMQHQDLGFDEAGEVVVLGLPTGGDLISTETPLSGDLDAIKARFLDHPAVTAASATFSTPSSGSSVVSAGVLEREDGTLDDASLVMYMTDHEFPSTYGLDILAGRDFDRAFATDAEDAYLLNETAVDRYGFTSPEAAVGRRIRMWGAEGQVIGVVRDFHHNPLDRAVRPMTIKVFPGAATSLSLRLNTDDAATTLREVEAIWNEVAGSWPFEAVFLDQQIERRYRAVHRFGRVFGTFAGLAILIAGLGLFGLTAFTVQQRTKEIGIRKVLGASVAQVVTLLSREVVVLVGVAVALVIPPTYLLMRRWLDTFAYRIDLEWAVFAGAGLGVLTLALAVVAAHATRAAQSNPVQALRSE